MRRAIREEWLLQYFCILLDFIALRWFKGMESLGWNSELGEFSFCFVMNLRYQISDQNIFISSM